MLKEGSCCQLLDPEVVDELGSKVCPLSGLSDFFGSLV